MLLMDGKELTRAINTAALGTAKGKLARGRPILECVRIDAADGYLTAVGYNLDAGVIASMPAGTNGTGLHTVLDAKALLQVLKSAKGTVGIEAQGNGVTITAGTARHQLMGFDLSEFPPFPEVVKEWEATIDGKDLAGVLAQVIPAASGDDARPGLETVCFEAKADESGGSGRLVLTTADGFRLHQAKVLASMPSSRKVIIPAAAIKAVQKLIKAQGYGTVRLWIQGEYKPSHKEGEPTQQVMIECNAGSLRTWGSPFQYPDYIQIIPKKYAFGARIQKDELIEAVRDAQATHANDEAYAMRLHFKGSTLTVSLKSEAAEYSRELAIGTVGPDELLLGVNAGFFKDAIEACAGEIVILEANQPSQPIGIRTADRGYLAIVMPMHIGE